MVTVGSEGREAVPEHPLRVQELRVLGAEPDTGNGQAHSALYRDELA